MPPVWMTFKQALALGANVRKGEKGSLVVYADTITRTETDAETNEQSARDIHYMKGYMVFNAEQIDGLSDLYYAKPAPRAHRAGRELLFRDRQLCATAAIAPVTASAPTMSRCRPSRVSDISCARSRSRPLRRGVSRRYVAEQTAWCSACK
jgi:hypothetical protein